jgi:glutathione S-transferase
VNAPQFTHFEDNKKADYVSKFPGGKIPGFEGADGFLLTETLAISKYGEPPSLPDLHNPCHFLHMTRLFAFSYPCLNHLVSRP